MHLTESQKKQLRALAHPKKPVVMVGNQGLTDRVMKEIGSALEIQELIKIKVRADDRKKRNALIEQIVEAHDCLLILRVGNVATLFKQNAEKPKIELKPAGE